MFYDYLDSLCAEKGLSVTELMKELDLSPSSASRWKNRGYKPSRVAAKKIADYFGITVTELLSGGMGEIDKKNKPTDELDELKRRLDEITADFSDEEMQKLIEFAEIYEAGLRNQSKQK